MRGSKWIGLESLIPTHWSTNRQMHLMYSLIQSTPTHIRIICYSACTHFYYHICVFTYIHTKSHAHNIHSTHHYNVYMHILYVLICTYIQFCSWQESRGHTMENVYLILLLTSMTTYFMNDGMNTLVTFQLKITVNFYLTPFIDLGLSISWGINCSPNAVQHCPCICHSPWSKLLHVMVKM